MATKERMKLHRKTYRNNLKRKVLDLYGKECACCGENEKLFLTLDHVNGGGTKHRREAGGSPEAVYRDILKKPFLPEEFRILCFNCNLGRERNDGVCPHEVG